MDNITKEKTKEYGHHLANSLVTQDSQESLPISKPEAILQTHDSKESNPILIKDSSIQRVQSLPSIEKPESPKIKQILTKKKKSQN